MPCASLAAPMCKVGPQEKEAASAPATRKRACRLTRAVHRRVGDAHVGLEVRRFTGLARYCRRFVEGYAEVAAPPTALGSPTARFV